MGAVLIRIGKDNDFVITQAIQIKILSDAGTNRRNNGAEFFIGQHLIQPLLFYI